MIAGKLGINLGRILRGLRQLGKYKKTQVRKWRGNLDEVGRRLYRVWTNLRKRCLSREHSDYALYGGKGVTICREWESFDRFDTWARTHGYERGLWLTRKRRDGPYSPSNCVWEEPAQAARRIRGTRGPGKSRTDVMAFGESKGPIAWSRDPRCAVKASTLCRRLRNGMPAENAITTPPRQRSEGTPSFFIEAFGERRCAEDWARGSNCHVTARTLRARIRAGVDPEIAITAPRRKARSDSKRV